MNSSLIDLDLFKISVADAIELESEGDRNSSTNFADGKSDGENNFEPIAYQWSNLDYRRGYWIGVINRIGIEDALVDGVETNEAIFV